MNRGSGSRFARRFFVLLAAAAVLLLISCFSERVAGGSSSTETGNEISLTGRVIDKDNKGLPGIVVISSRTGLADTTDAQGHYQIKGKLDTVSLALFPVGSGFAARIAENVLDTLVFTQNGQEVAALPVFKWVDNLPDIKIVQRDISGVLLTTSVKIAKVEAVIAGDGIPVGQPVVIEFFYNALASHYSGFAYFRGTASITSYAVFIKVYDSLGRFTGRSLTIPFNSNAGNIVVPAFNPGNAIPRTLAGRDTLLSVGDTLLLHGAVVDSFGGTVSKWEWNIGGMGFVRTSSGDTAIVLPPDTSLGYLCVLRVTDNDGNTALDTLSVRIVRDPPKPTILGNSTVKVSVPITFTAQVVQQFGHVVMYRWDDGKGGGWVDSSASMSQAAFTYQMKGGYTVRLYVRDDDGNVDSATRVVTVGNDNPVVSGMRDTTVSVNDSVMLTVIASDPEGIRRYLWDLDGNGVFEDTTVSSIHGHKYPSVPGLVRSIVRVEDNFDGVTLDTALVNVVLDKPVPSIQGNSTVKVNVPITLTAQVTQQFGTIVMYKWDDGKGGGWLDSSLSMTQKSFIYLTKGQYTVLLYVRDDDGNADSAGKVITVGNDNPVVSGMRDTTISVNDSVAFTVSASDPEGIRRYLWDMGGNGVFEDTTVSNIHGHKYPAVPGLVRSIVRVEDNFDGVTLDTALVNVVLDKPVPAIQGSSTVKVDIPLLLTAQVTQQFGSILMYKWDDGKSLGWDDSSSSLTQKSYTYQTKGAYTIRLYVRDDDGNADSTTKVMTVGNDNPVIVSALRDTMVSVNDTLPFTISATDPEGIKWCLWDYGADGTYEDTTLTGSKTFVMPAAPGQVKVAVTIHDNFDGVTRDTAVVTVVLDKPVPSIQGNSTVKVNVPITLTAQVTQQFGSVVMYKWDDGKSQGWDDSSSNLTQKSYTYQTRGAYTIRLYVRDDDGNADSATKTITVTNDNPVVSGMRDTTISVNDSVTFTVTATDPEGILRCLWDMDGDGVFEDTTTANVRGHKYPSVPGLVRSVARVEDDFDGVTLDTALVTVVLDPPVVYAGKDTMVSVNDLVSLKGWATDGFGIIVMLERSFGGGPFIPASSPETTIVAPPAENPNYLVVLRATDDDGNVVTDTAAVKVVQPLAAPESPAPASPANASSGVPISTTLAWNAAMDAVTYRLQVSTNSGFTTTLVDDSSLTGTFRTSGSLTANTTYFWRVRAKNVTGVSAYSEIWSFTTSVAPPDPPGLATPRNGTTNLPVHVWFNWGNAGADTYRLQVSDEPNFNSTVFDDSTITYNAKPTVGPLAKNTTYYWRLNAKNAGGTGAYSQTFHFTTTSDTGAAWTTQNSGTAQALFCVAWSGSRYVAFGQNGTLLTSSNGVAWTSEPSPTSSPVRSLVWMGNQFVAVGDDGILTSPDGIGWAGQVSEASSMSQVAWSGMMLVAVEGSGSRYVHTSPDGIIWTKTDLGSTHDLQAVTWDGSQFIAVGYQDFFTSPDGLNWTKRFTTSGSEWFWSVACGGGQCVTVGMAANGPFQGVVRASPNGASWPVRSVGSTNQFNSVTWAGDRFVIVGEYGAILTSQDGITWSSQNSKTAEPLRNVTWTESRLIAVGAGGTVLTLP